MSSQPSLAPKPGPQANCECKININSLNKQISTRIKLVKLNSALLIICEIGYCNHPLIEDILFL